MNAWFFSSLFHLSGKRSKLRINEDTLSISLRDNNTVVIAARVYAEVSAKSVRIIFPKIKHNSYIKIGFSLQYDV